MLFKQMFFNTDNKYKVFSRAFKFQHCEKLQDFKAKWESFTDEINTILWPTTTNFSLLL